MSTPVRLAAILAGYVLAALFAAGCVWLWRIVSPADPASAGMSAFGDALLLLAVFAVAASIPTLFAGLWIWKKIRRRA